MREIKFRGRCKNNGKWFYYGDYCTIPNPNILFYNQDNEIDCIEVNESTVGQYIGLKDNKGVEIYDEDIIEFYDGNELVRGEVEWLQEGCMFVVRVSNETGQHYLELCGDEKFNCNVIGNIYDNKVLLEN